MNKVTTVMLVWLAATGVTLPESGPAPVPKPNSARSEEQLPAAAPEQAAPETPDATTPQPLPPSGTAPTPQPDPRDDGKTPPSDPPEPSDPAKPSDLPKPADTPTPDAKSAAPVDESAKPEEPAEPATPPVPPDPAPPDPAPEAETAEALALCLKDLTAIGATYEMLPTVDDAGGCGIANPVSISRLLPDVALEPAATIRCETALSLARMTRDMLMPAAERAFPDKPKLSAIGHASGYVCRLRNSAETGKISEHAYGNAIDIAALRFGKEAWPVMIAKQDDGTPEAAFQRALNAIACLYFTTVLSPGSDATHQDHLHLDVIARKGGFRYCR